MDNFLNELAANAVQSSNINTSLTMMQNKFDTTGFVLNNYKHHYKGCLYFGSDKHINN